MFEERKFEPLNNEEPLAKDNKNPIYTFIYII